MKIKLEELKRKILEEKRRYAAQHGYRLNPDKRVLNFVITGLARNLQEKKLEYCPCRPLSGNPQKDKKKICPCFWHKEEIEKQGFCHCRLFFKK